MKIYCTNNECQHYRVLEEPSQFVFNKLRIPFSDEKINGFCSIIPQINPVTYESPDFRREQSVCHQSQGICKQLICLHNNEGACLRDEILIDEAIISKYIVCKCFSNRSLSGHVDWFKNLKSDGTAKGGHISDIEAKKINPRKRF